MRSPSKDISPSAKPLDNAFSPAYLTRLREQEEVLTAAEAEMAGPWKTEPVRDKPGAVAVLRTREELDAGDRPIALWWHPERAQLFTILLPALDREPLVHLVEGETPDGYRSSPSMGSRVRRSPAGSTGTSLGGPRGCTCSRRSSAHRKPSPLCSKRRDWEPRSRWDASALADSSRCRIG